MKSFSFLVGVIYISIMVAFAAAEIGEMSSCEVFTWDIPFIMFAAVAFPFFLGYDAGRKSE